MKVFQLFSPSSLTRFLFPNNLMHSIDVLVPVIWASSVRTRVVSPRLAELRFPVYLTEKKNILLTVSTMADIVGHLVLTVAHCGCNPWDLEV